MISAVFTIAMILLPGCSSNEEPPITSGTVVWKRHREAYTRIIPETVMDADGDLYTVWVTDHLPESFELTFEDGEKSRTLSVTEMIYRSVDVGGRIDMEPIEIPVVEEIRK